MKKLVVLLAILLVAVFIISGCGEKTTPPVVTQPTQTTPAVPATTAAATSAAPTTPAKPQPVYGGVFEMITAAGPQALGYTPDMGPADASAVFPAVERLLDIAEGGKGLEGSLAESWKEDPEKLTITFNIRKGIKFSDGSELNAEVVKWNYQMLVNAKRLQLLPALKSIEITDPYTVVMNLNHWTNQILPSWGWTAIFSKKAYDDVSGGDLEKYRAWAKTNVVGTGPFILKEFKKDSHITWVKNANYWRTGLPYLDGINVRYIPNTATAATIFEAKQADQWTSPDPVSLQALLAKGFKEQKSDWAGLVYSIVPNTTDEKSRWNNLKLRQALAHAVDSSAIAKAIGKGLYIPLTYLPPVGQWGYDPKYPAPSYNPAKAKQLLAEAGYPNGLKVNLLILSDPLNQDIGVAIKSFLDAVGIETNLDVADPGRYNGLIYGTKPYEDLAFMMTGGTTDANYLITYSRWFSSDPFTNMAAFGHTPEQIAMDKASTALVDHAQQQEVMFKLMKWLNDEQRVIPLYLAPGVALIQPYVNSTQYHQGFARWRTELVWLAKK
ncbi:MAG TPA: ABC transporter substrate-binding protein [Dehalococcoidales bacterium]|nr:ABC transporter substrate-binding protein [Dehalococcoidales bacterium]